MYLLEQKQFRRTEILVIRHEGEEGLAIEPERQARYAEVKSSSWPKENFTAPEKAGLDYPLDHTRSEPMTFKIYNRKQFHIFTCLRKCLYCKE